MNTKREVPLFMQVRINGELKKRLVARFDEFNQPYPALNDGEKFMRVNNNIPIIFLKKENE